MPAPGTNMHLRFLCVFPWMESKALFSELDSPNASFGHWVGRVDLSSPILVDLTTF